MDDKDNNFFDPDTPLILEKELTSPLVLNKEINLSSNKENNKKDEILKIKNLIELKYSSKNKIINSTVKKDFEKQFLFIKNSAQKINNDIKEKTRLINNNIKNQKKKIELLYQEKNSLNQSKLEFNENKNKIQLDIINNQQKLIDNNKKDINKLKSAVNDLEKRLKETFLKNRSLEINNNELKNTLNKYISHNKKLDKEIKDFKKKHQESALSVEQINQIDSRIDDRIKFYQEENTRLSSELATFQNKYEIISKNFNEVEFEKNSIFKQIQELNNSLNKVDLPSKPPGDENKEIQSTNSKILNEIDENDKKNDPDNTKSKKNLDLEITDIFN